MSGDSKKHLTYEDRKTLEILLNSERHLNDVANKMGISRTCLYLERKRMGSLKVKYNADIAHGHYSNKRSNADRIRTAKKHKISLSYRLYSIISQMMKINKDPRISELISRCILILETQSIKRC